ncbi:HNH endonuclease [Kitasatospora sp. NPDC056446]|uniref:HNH endonuclease n=1 Tax=Kitasatospora sp. NPDC056446 TaxID=3345819 RepID=UPI0036BD8273
MTRCTERVVFGPMQLFTEGVLCAVSTADSPGTLRSPPQGVRSPSDSPGASKVASLVARRHSEAERLRRLVDRAGSAVCGLCGGDFPAALVDVDHRTPIALGGEDTDDNVWPLCRECHRGKTAADFGVFQVGP